MDLTTKKEEKGRKPYNYYYEYCKYLLQTKSKALGFVCLFFLKINFQPGRNIQRLSTN